MAGSRGVENEVAKPPTAPGRGNAAPASGVAAPAAPPLPFFVQRAAAPVEEESSGDEVCFNHRPLLVAAAPRQPPSTALNAAPQPHAPPAPPDRGDRGDRGALARAKMQTLGCAKKDRKVPTDEKKGEPKQITSVRPVSPAGPAPTDGTSPEDDSSSSGEEDQGQRGRSWWAQFFQLKLQGSSSVASLKVSLARLQLTDVDLPSLTGALERVLHDLRDEDPDLGDSGRPNRQPVRVLMDFDLSDNCISDSGAVWLFGWLMHRPQEVRCRVLRLARNRLGDASLEWLSALVCQQHSAIEELHLAENAITATGAAHLLLSFALHPFEAYPFLDPRGLFAPAAVCLDRNPIQEPGLLARLRLRSNLRAACKDGHLRTSNFNSTPHVQLGAAFPDEAARSSTVLPLALEKVCAGGSWPSLPQLPKPQVKEAAGNDEAFDRQVPKGKTFRRELLVDEEEGAGLELETVTDGLRICEIMEIPGQPGLRMGDVIVAIDGLPLWWHACQHDQVDIDEDDDFPSARFRARFRRGARLDILRQEASAPPPGAAAPPARPGPGAAAAGRGRKRFACPICWDTFDLWNDCLEHLREFGHEPPKLESSNRKLEDASGCLRRWMATCMAAARGEAVAAAATAPTAAAKTANGVSAEQWMAADEPEKAETLLLPASIGVLGERCRMAVEALAEEASRFGFEQGCTVWTLPNGLRAQCPAGAAASEKVASLAEQLLQIMHFYLPDVDDKEALGEEDEELAEWTAWLEQMLQQAEETRQPKEPKSPRAVQELSHATGPPPASDPRSAAPDIRLLLLCGLPGSGKSTLARSFAKSSQWCVVNQDTLGSRQACMKVARHALSDRIGHVVIDRCNVTRGQRGIWTLIASEFNLSPSQVGCVWLDVPDEDCGRRVLQRFGHRTLPPREASLKVIRSFARQWQAPDANVEGFGRLWRLATDGDQDMFLADFGLSRFEPERSPQVEVPRFPEAVEEEPSPAPKVDVSTTEVPASAASAAAPAPRKEKVGSNKILHAEPMASPPDEPLPAPVDESQVLSNNLVLSDVAPEPVPQPQPELVEEPFSPSPNPSPSSFAADVWSCDCGEINKRKRQVCNNCFAEQPRTNVLIPAVLPDRAAVPNGNDAAAVPVADVAEEPGPISPVEASPVEQDSSGGRGYTADFWRLPMLEEDLSPPK